MNDANICKGTLHMTKTGPGHRGGRGPSSYWMQDPEMVFRELNLKEGDTFLDIGCGAGDYSLHAAKEVGEKGMVYATDLHSGLIESLLDKAQNDDLNNIKALVNDIRSPLPLENKCIDVCLISTVLHCLDLKIHGIELFNEVKRVLKPDGRLVIIECKKEDAQFGPPLHMRISADEIEKILSEYGFIKADVTDLGFNYMATFSVFKLNSILCEPSQKA